MRHLLILALLGACRLTHHPTEAAVVPTPSGEGWQAVLDGTPVEHEAVVSARWKAATKGLIDLSDPRAKQAGHDKTMPIVLMVHVLRHPDKGVFIVDTGITADRAAGGHGAVRGAVRPFLKDLQPVEPLAAILERQPEPLAGVLVTHSHFDHVLGLPDVPEGVPVYFGKDETSLTDWRAPLMRPTYKALLRDRDPVRELGPAQSVDLGELRAIDLLGDGSIWAIPSPGHTPGSLAFLARTQDGVQLFAGDTSHTRWGWKNGVPPGKFTHDRQGNTVSLHALRALAEAHPEITVHVGHEEAPIPGGE